MSQLPGFTALGGCHRRLAHVEITQACASRAIPASTSVIDVLAGSFLGPPFLLSKLVLAQGSNAGKAPACRYRSDRPATTSLIKCCRYSCLQELNRSLKKTRNEVDQALRVLNTRMEKSGMRSSS